MAVQNPSGCLAMSILGLATMVLLVYRVLEGTVYCWAARDQAEGAAWAAPGVIEVRDNLRVVL